MLTRAIRAAWRRRFVPLAFNPYLQAFPPGHFYSPIPARDAKPRELTHIPGFDLRAADQLALAARLHPYRLESTRYRPDNAMFSPADAWLLSALMDDLRPRRIIEIGAGFSTAVMLDTGEHWPTLLDLTCIEPYPDRLRQIQRPGDAVRLIERPVQAVPLETFDALQAHDILFVDSSHVAKLGSDVLWLITRVLPRLAPGVWIHFHDIFWPDYPADWVAEGRAWNEGYMVQAFLQFNDTFVVRWFNSYLAQTYDHLAHLHTGSGLWIERIEAPRIH